VIFLTIEHICDINKEWIHRYGGNYTAFNNNFLFKEKLEHILVAIQYPIFGVDLYPSLLDKAAALAWEINKGHVFNDGSKRTGMQTAIEFLEINNAITLFHSNSIVEIALEIANENISVKDVASRFFPFVELPILLA